MRAARFWFLALVVWIGAFATAQTPTDYIIGPEDVITVNTRDIAEASGEFLVRPDGKISFPVVGEILVSGLTVTQAEKVIYEKLTEKEFKKTIEVTVNVKTMRANRIYVLGSVGAPGMQDAKPNWRLTELIAAAGGLTTLPEQLTALVWRRGEPPKRIPLKQVFVEASEEANIEVKPGDVVNIQGKPMVRVNVTGKVVKPGLVDVFEGDGAVEAVSAMGGGLPDAALSKAKIMRKGQEISVDLYKAIYLGTPEANVPLQDGDTIYIPENKAKVAVMGVVSKPGPVEIPDGRPLRLVEAIGLAGGPIREAKTDAVMLARRDDKGGFVEKAYNLNQIRSGKAGIEDPILQDGDVIFVAQSGKPNTGTIGQILGLILTGGGLFGRLGGF